MLPALLMLAVAASPARVVVNEVMANPSGGDGAGSPEDRNEFVELFNRTDDTIDLGGWHLSDLDDWDTLRAWDDTLIRVKYAHVRINSTLIFPHSYALVLDPEYTDPDTPGGFPQPYRFSDRLLIVRPGNTTIGNGLSGSDPVLLCSRDWADTSSFGLYPGGPHDAGDGFSWERTGPDAPDCDTTWYVCPDTAGCTPGRVNSITTRKNLKLESILCYPLSLVPGVAETVSISVRNTGRVQAAGWRVRFYEDRNQNSREDAGERIGLQDGPDLAAGQSVGLVATWPEPGPGGHIVAAELDYDGDSDTADNRAVMALFLADQIRHFSLGSERFGPNLKTGPETLAIYYSLPDNKGNLSVKVYDLTGRERAVVFEGRPTAKDGVLVWNGFGSIRALLPTGLYALACEYKTEKTVILEKKTVVLARGR
jgi:hypothetical protein